MEQIKHDTIKICALVILKKARDKGIRIPNDVILKEATRQADEILKDKKAGTLDELEEELAGPFYF